MSGKYNKSGLKKKEVFVDYSNHLLLKDLKLDKTAVVSGKFKTKNNNLVYLINKSAGWRRIYNLPKEIKFQGKWRLNSNQDLVLNLKKTEFAKGTLVLKGKILKVDADYLIFEIKSKNSAVKNEISYLKLKGLWRADKYNRITFEVKKKKVPDILTLKGVWQLNKNQKIIYTYDKLNLKTKRTSKGILTFDGFWQINKKNRLKFVLSKSSQSFFDFRVQIQTPNLYPAKGIIKYRLGIGLKKNKSRKSLTLYGNWKFSRKLGLVFEMHYGRSSSKSIYFGATLNLSQKDKVIFTLRAKDNKNLGFVLIFKRGSLSRSDLEYFIQLKKQGKGIYAGLGMRLRF